VSTRPKKIIVDVTIPASEHAGNHAGRVRWEITLDKAKPYHFAAAIRAAESIAMALQGERDERQCGGTHG
jgi:hypothetical protein